MAMATLTAAWEGRSRDDEVGAGALISGRGHRSRPVWGCHECAPDVGRCHEPEDSLDTGAVAREAGSPRAAPSLHLEGAVGPPMCGPASAPSGGPPGSV